ncbi:hypothetical protein DTO280E4_5944 [Paecilomyces variotii]|nr:hypothetical protein DTO207G8_5786 [Paecilomyces variotii]KAJ9265092.1 hypothetical protein DTO195F2_2104 [Paecilomyces variotii]KAJ9303381.1 hypothetical protein DTO217A2_7076 [Paecilomyces variotii]KAJ9356753.1 hypothetical protein DTO280E4_5944 [Paecilomyces variotii]KAJ9367883.1 hypothetical protein DTO282E5_7484 [Paecilomyces variotii]
MDRSWIDLTRLTHYYLLALDNLCFNNTLYTIFFFAHAYLSGITCCPAATGPPNFRIFLITIIIIYDDHHSNYRMSS